MYLCILSVSMFGIGIKKRKKKNGIGVCKLICTWSKGGKKCRQEMISQTIPQIPCLGRENNHHHYHHNVLSTDKAHLNSHDHFQTLCICLTHRRSRIQWSPCGHQQSTAAWWDSLWSEHWAKTGPWSPGWCDHCRPTQSARYEGSDPSQTKTNSEHWNQIRAKVILCWLVSSVQD